MSRNRKFDRRAWLLFTLACITLLVLGGLVLSHWENVSGQSAAGTPGNADVDQALIQQLRQALSNSRLSVADRQDLQKKLAYTEHLAAQRADRPVGHAPKGTMVPPVPMPQSAVIPPGSATDSEERILAGSEGMLHPWEANINNLWEGTYNGIPYQIFAGSAPDDPTQGLVVVMEYPTGSGLPARHTYLAPTQSGALRIVARQAGRLQCAAANGATLYFDLETRVFGF